MEKPLPVDCADESSSSDDDDAQQPVLSKEPLLVAKIIHGFVLHAEDAKIYQVRKARHLQSFVEEFPAARVKQYIFGD